MNRDCRFTTPTPHRSSRSQYGRPMAAPSPDNSVQPVGSSRRRHGVPANTHRRIHPGDSTICYDRRSHADAVPRFFIALRTQTPIRLRRSGKPCRWAIGHASTLDCLKTENFTFTGDCNLELAKSGAIGFPMELAFSAASKASHLIGISKPARLRACHQGNQSCRKHGHGTGIGSAVRPGPILSDRLPAAVLECRRAQFHDPVTRILSGYPAASYGMLVLYPKSLSMLAIQGVSESLSSVRQAVLPPQTTRAVCFDAAQGILGRCATSRLRWARARSSASSAPTAAEKARSCKS